MTSQTSVVRLTDASFDQALADHTDVVLVDFWAGWCGPCRAIGAAPKAEIIKRLDAAA